MKRTYLFLLGLLALAGCSTSKTGQFHRPDPTDTLPPSEAASAAITQPTETEAMESATPAPAGESSNPVVKSTKEQIFSYLSELFILGPDVVKVVPLRGDLETAGVLRRVCPAVDKGELDVDRSVHIPGRSTTKAAVPTPAWTST